MAPVVMVFSTSLVAVAAFMRVDPVSTSGPTLGRISTSQVPVSSCGGSEQDTRPVTAPSVCARDSAAPTNGPGTLAPAPQEDCPRQTYPPLSAGGGKSGEPKAAIPSP